MNCKDFDQQNIQQTVTTLTQHTVIHYICLVIINFTMWTVQLS